MNVRQVLGVVRKVLLPGPVSHYFGVEVMRCNVDGGLITKHTCPSDGNGNVKEHMCFYQQHAGHELKSPTMLWVWEMIGIWLKIVR